MLLPLLLGLLLGFRSKGPSSFFTEAGWTLLCGLLFALLSTWVFAPMQLELPWFESDFIDYCMGIVNFPDQSAYFPTRRSRLAAALPWFLASC